METNDNRTTKTAQVISLEEVRARRALKVFHARVGRLRESVADMRRAVEPEAPLLAFRREPPY